MNLLKIVTILNWTVIAFLGYLVIMETLNPTKGGDAAGRGIGMAIYYFAMIALAVLIILNLLPYNWARYTAFGLVALPAAFFIVRPRWQRLKRNVDNMIEAAKPIFPDKERDRIARAIYDGNPEEVKKLLQEPIPRINEGGDLVYFAINTANSSTHLIAERLECIRLLMQAGMRLDSLKTDEVPIHMAVADTGNSALLRFLLEQGADPNVVHYYFKRAIIFEAIGGYQEPEASVRALLEFGANPNVTAVYDDEEGPISPLIKAARMGRWGVCVALLEKGADVHFTTKNGQTLQSYVDMANKEFSPDGYSTREDLDRLNQALRK